MRYVWQLASVVLPVAALAGCSAVQRASIGALVVTTVDLDADPAVPGRADPPSPTRFIVRSEGSSIEVRSGALYGSFESRIARFRGRLVVDARDAGRGRIVVDFDMTSLENPSRLVTAALQYEFLEVDAYPHATLEARFERTGAAPDERIVRGTLDLHGVRREISFKGRLVREGNDFHFTSTFTLDRLAFGIRQHDSWDWVNDNDVRVRIDVRGTPERVTAEEVP
jgi:polyisoprenoid-binding protein YceI